MIIEHVALYVNDLIAARNFFVRYLGGRSDNGYHNPQMYIPTQCSLTLSA